ncbi:hypothetical protein D3C80_1737490 [compost metagenome]
MVAALDQASVIADHHLHCPIRAVFTLKCLQLAGQLVVCLQVTVVSAQALYLALTLEPVEQAVTQQHRGRIAPARALVAAHHIALGNHGNPWPGQHFTGQRLVQAQ